MSKGRDRVICVPLSEAEWQAFIERHPEPVEWLRGQILSQIEGGPRPLPEPQSLVRRPKAWSTSRV